jgi:hypothetical protein
MSEALRREMMIYGIDVIMVVPGPVATAIWDKGEAADLSAYEGTIYSPIVERFRRYMIEDGRKGLKPEMPGRNCACRTDRPAPQDKLRCNSKTLQELDFASASAEEGARHVDRKTAGPETDASANLRCMVSKIFACPTARSCRVGPERLLDRT